MTKRDQSFTAGLGGQIAFEVVHTIFLTSSGYRTFLEVVKRCFETDATICFDLIVLSFCELKGFSDLFLKYEKIKQCPTFQTSKPTV